MLEEYHPPPADPSPDQRRIFRMTILAPVEADRIVEVEKVSTEFSKRVGALVDGAIEVDTSFPTPEEVAAQQAIEAKFAEWLAKHNAAHERRNAARLTSRETEVVEYMVSGLTNKEIGVKLHLAEATIKGYAATVMNKFGVSTRTELAALLSILYSP